MIQVEKLTRFYGTFCAVDGIDLDVRKGEITGLLGPNGAGKTTTLRMLTGYLAPTSGTIRIKDWSIDEHLLQIKKLIGYLPESAPLYHAMLVYDYLDYIAGIRGLDKRRRMERIHELSDLCDLRSIMHKPIGELSKGLRQRVGLAHAMMEDPEILVLDEPTSGLDPNQIAEIRDIIRHFGREKTVILSTHILSEAEATCDRIVIIDKGKIVADGSTEALKKESTAQEKVVVVTLLKADFASASMRFRLLPGVTGVELMESADPDILRLRLTTDSRDNLREMIYSCIKETDWILLELTTEDKSLENIFRELTKEA
ncbi:MAG TPA: ATP-binding cassette domain-containing protein [Deltaproteobacteria bacterium]|mgnify:CR=1 FL=1|jgi:ABC-2 type transport system ATP-binding protein|nr:ATP-binding cassette domain-containing protein [Deltaproteobacteria bacterium]HOI08078.1 ATP-binding cassette domain-containing protein [Deltaproteobacteria bacterium]